MEAWEQAESDKLEGNKSHCLNELGGYSGMSDYISYLRPDEKLNR